MWLNVVSTHIHFTDFDGSDWFITDEKKAIVLKFSQRYDVYVPALQR